MMAAVLSVFPSFGSLVWLVGYRRLQVCDDRCAEAYSGSRTWPVH